MEDGLITGHRKAIQGREAYLAQLIDQNLWVEHLIFRANTLLCHFLNEMIEGLRLLELSLLRFEQLRPLLICQALLDERSLLLDDADHPI